MDPDSYAILLAKMRFTTFRRKENAIIGTESDGIRCCFCFSYEEVYLKKKLRTKKRKRNGVGAVALAGCCLQSVARGNEKKGLGKRKSLKVHKLCRGMSLVRNELPQWSVKYWRNNLYSWRSRASPRNLFFPLSPISIISLLVMLLRGIVTKSGSRDKFDIDRKTRDAQIHRVVSGTFVILETRREFFADGTLSCGLSETAWLRDMLIWKYSMQEHGAINGWLLPPGFMNSCLLEMY